MVKLRNIIMIYELERQGLSISEIVRKTGLNRKTARKYLARGFGGSGVRPHAVATAARLRCVATFPATTRLRCGPCCDSFSGRYKWRPKELNLTYNTIPGWLFFIHPVGKCFLPKILTDNLGKINSNRDFPLT